MFVMNLKLLIVFLVGIIFVDLALASDESSARSLFIKKSGSSFSNTFDSKEVDLTKSQQDKKISPKNNRGDDDKNELKKINYIGLSAAVYQLNASNKFEMVSPTKLFKTGDKVRVLITSNKAGYITSSAISPQGILTIIGEQKVAADETITVPQKGSIKFDGQTGIEELLFVLSSKSGVGRNLTNPDSADLKNGCKKSSAQRDLVIENSSNDFFLLSNDGKCLEQNGKSRDLVVESDQNVDYGVVPENQFSKGNILGLKLYLKHN